MSEVKDKYDIAELREILEDYERATGSARAKAILADFNASLPYFKKIIPHDYQHMLTAISRYEEQGISHDNAVKEAFREMTQG